MGAFDDLIAPAPQRGGAFDDLIAGGTPQSFSSSEPSRLQAFGYSAADAASLGFGDEGAGVLAGVGAVLGGRDFALAYRTRVDAARQRLEEARARHPISSAAGALTGAGATFLVPGGAAATGARLGLGGVAAAGRAAQGLVTGERLLPYGSALLREAAGRGGRALGAQSLLGAGTGAAFGAAYGAGSANENDRLQGALSGGAYGAALGAVGPAAFQLLGNAGRIAYQNPVLRTATGAAAGGGVGYFTGEPGDREQNALRGAAFGAGVGAFSRPALTAARQAFANPLGYANQTSMAGVVPPPLGGSGGSAKPNVPKGVVSAVDRLLGRQRSDVESLARSIETARAEPMGRTLADLGGEQFLSKVDALAQLPGQTGPRAAALAEARVRDLPGQITGELQSRLGVSQSPTQALNSLADEYRLVSRELYEPLLRQPVAPQALARVEPILQRLPESVLNRANRVMDDLARIDGIEVSAMSGAQRLHYLKMALDDAIQGMERVEGLGAAQRAGLRRLKGEFLEAVEGDPARGIEPIIPGYREARMRWGGLKDAEEAIDLGRKALSQRPEEVREIMARMTPFERQHFQIAAADEMIRKVMRASGEVGHRNAANPLNSTELQNVVREIFDDAGEAEAFLRMLNERNQLARNATSWIGNSATARRAAQAGDQFLAAMADAGLTGASGNPGAAVSQAGRSALNALRGRFFEQQNDELGNALLRVVDEGTTEDRAFIRELMRELRKRERARASRAESAGRDAALNVVGVDTARDAYQPY